MTRPSALILRLFRQPVLALGGTLAGALAVVCLGGMTGRMAQTPAAAQAPPAETAPSRQAARPQRALAGADFGYTQFRVNGNTAKRIDARGATWRLSNYGPRQNRYPFLIDGSVPGTQVAGGTIDGEVPLGLEWAEIYTNSAAVMARDAPGIALLGWTIRQAWDGIRIAGASEDFRIAGAAVCTIRDDAVENDHGNAGTISASLFDGVFSGLSMARREMPDFSGRVVTLDGVLMRMQSYPFEGRLTHGAPFKVEAHSPALKVRDTVLAIEDVTHIGQGRLAQAWETMREASGNYFLNLSDDPLPESYPRPGRGWTVLEGAAARAHWQSARAHWFAAAPFGAGRAGPCP